MFYEQRVYRTTTCINVGQLEQSAETDLDPYFCYNSGHELFIFKILLIAIDWKF